MMARPKGVFPVTCLRWCEHRKDRGPKLFLAHRIRVAKSWAQFADIGVLCCDSPDEAVGYFANMIVVVRDEEQAMDTINDF